MSMILKHRSIVKDDFAFPFHTKQRTIGFNYFSRSSHVNKKETIAGFKRFRYTQQVPLKPLKPSQTKPEAKKKPVKASSKIKTAPRHINQEGELFAGSATIGSSPSPRHMPIPMFYVRESIKEF
ncbi:unnamed protein product [Cochlearia groenlandica]